MTSTRSTLELRAAQHIGRADLPRRSLKLNMDTVLVVWDDPKLCALIYSEEYGYKVGRTFMVTPRRAAAMRSIFEDWNRS